MNSSINVDEEENLLFFKKEKNKYTLRKIYMWGLLNKFQVFSK